MNDEGFIGAALASFDPTTDPDVLAARTRASMHLEESIPDGRYCYRFTGPRQMEPCPFHAEIRALPATMNGYCAFLDRGDWQANAPSFLWDAVKICSVNLDQALDELDDPETQ